MWKLLRVLEDDEKEFHQSEHTEVNKNLKKNMFLLVCSWFCLLCNKFTILLGFWLSNVRLIAKYFCCLSTIHKGKRRLKLCTSCIVLFFSMIVRATAAHSSVDRQVFVGCVRITYWLEMLGFKCTWKTGKIY